MTFAGKKLQDIYNGGSQALSEAEASSKESFRNKTNAHMQVRKEKEDVSTSKVESKFAEYEADLRGLMTQSVDRIKEVMANEVQETDRYVQYVSGELKLVADKLKSSIKDLQQTYEENIRHSSATAHDQFESTIEESQLDLERNENASSKHLKAHGTFVLNSLQQKLDHSLWESRGDEKQFSGSLFKTYMQRANGIDAHFSSLMQRMQSELQPAFKTMESQSASIEADLERDAQSLIGHIETRSQEVETQLKQFFEQTVEQHNTTLRDTLTRVTEELGRIHEGTTGKLTEQTRELSSSLVVASGEAQESLRTRCKSIRGQVDSTMETFTQRIDQRLQQAVSAKENLEAEKNSIFQSIRQELANIRDSYESRLQSLKVEALQRVQSIVLETEREIVSSRERCESKMLSDCQHVKNELERAITQFLDLLGQRRKDALDEIARAADDQSDASQSQKPQEPPRQRKVKRAKDEQNPES